MAESHRDNRGHRGLPIFVTQNQWRSCDLRMITKRLKIIRFCPTTKRFGLQSDKQQSFVKTQKGLNISHQDKQENTTSTIRFIFKSRGQLKCTYPTFESELIIRFISHMKSQDIKHLRKTNIRTYKSYQVHDVERLKAGLEPWTTYRSPINCCKYVYQNTGSYFSVKGKS